LQIQTTNVHIEGDGRIGAPLFPSKKKKRSVVSMMMKIVNCGIAHSMLPHVAMSKRAKETHDNNKTKQNAMYGYYALNGHKSEAIVERHCDSAAKTASARWRRSTVQVEQGRVSTAGSKRQPSRFTAA
jgi:hypothetical protein